FFPANGIVLVQHLSDGAPAAGVRVTVYRNVVSPNSAPAVPAVCAAGSSGPGGEIDFRGVDLERCYAGSSADQAPDLGVVATEGSDAATLTLYGGSGLYRFNVAGGWTGGAPLPRGIVFSDRQMYQPGETGRITGVAYYASGNRIVADRNATYRVKLTDPSNAVTSLGTVKTDAYGIFSLPIAFSKAQALGYYTVDAKGANGNDVNGSLRVAEFKPPNFKLTLDVSAQSAAAGGSVRAAATAAYLFGAPLQGGAAHAYVTRATATVQPKGWDDFWFGRQWFWPEETPSFDSDVLQRDLPLDAAGKTTLDVAVPAALPFPMTYTIDMEATDVSHLSVSDSKSFLALPSDATIGLDSGVVGPAGKPMPIRAIVTDADGRAIAGRAIHLDLQKMTYTSATQQVEGGASADQAVKYETVGSADATSGDKAVSVDLTPPDTGPYRVRATFAGAKTDASATDIQVFAFGAGEADWGQSDPSVAAVQLDKKSYAVGDTATVLVASPFDRSDVYVSVVRGDAIYRTILRDVRGAARVPFKITADMLPNAAFQAVVVRRGANLASLKPGSLDTLARTGMAAFDVDVAARYLKLAIVPHAATVAPGGSQRVSFTLTRKNGSAAPGEIVAMVVNDAILQLSGYRLPDLVTTVFAGQPISAMLADSRDGIVLKTQSPPVEKGFGYGGGYLAGAASTRVRQNFLPLAYYGTVKTDSSGKASVSFKMPDDLTTWRVMAVAVGNDDAHFATDDATFVSTQPLIGNPLLPQFARTGDAFDLGVSLSNQTGAAGALDLVMKLTGALTFASGDPRAQTSTQQAA
ncbi:MAG TPA: alpha-2-macroglobulin family protein, partial [Candidatus Tumulicola sp.]